MSLKWHGTLHNTNPRGVFEYLSSEKKSHVESVWFSLHQLIWFFITSFDCYLWTEQGVRPELLFYVATVINKLYGTDFKTGSWKKQNRTTQNRARLVVELLQNHTLNTWYWLVHGQNAVYEIPLIYVFGVLGLRQSFFVFGFRQL